MVEKQWIWQNKNWQNFDVDYSIFESQIQEIVKITTPLNILAANLETNKKLQLNEKIILDEVLNSAKIENEILDRDSVRSSICNHLGIDSSQKNTNKSVKNFVEMMLSSVYNFDKKLDKAEILNWHKLLFKNNQLLFETRIGKYRNSKMQVISGRYGKQKIHFEAPFEREKCIDEIMQQFINYFNKQDATNDYIKAAIIKFYFITIHPFDDGNGRISRVLAERYLAKIDKNHLRLYSISTQFEKHKKDYYNILQGVQSNKIGIEKWIEFFLQQIINASKQSLHILKKINYSTIFWDKYRSLDFNSRQKKLLIRILETDDFINGIGRKKYKNLVKTTDITASRDLKDLIEKQILTTTGGGRSVKYFLKIDNEY
jgi:Fic family protein